MDQRAIIRLIANFRGEHHPAYENDPIFYRRVALTLGIAVVLSLGGLIMLAFIGKEAPQGIIALGSVALGALAGVFAVGSKRK